MQSRICWMLIKKTKYLFNSDKTKSKLKFIKGSLFSIIMGFIVSGIFLSLLKINPFTYFALLFGINFDKNFYQISLNWMAVYIVAGLSMAVAFKSGVFNIGAPGQILTATSVSTILFFYIKGPKTTTINASMIVLMLIACIISASFLALIAGILKALFNIHEVVSTILLNWSVFYIFKWFFNKFKDFSGGLSFTSKNIPSDQLVIGSNTVIIPLLIALICVILVWVLFSKTTLGFKLKAIGSSITGSKYIGINVKTQIMSSLALSGAIAGIAGFILIFTVTPNNFFASNSLPTVGFDAIAVSLVAFNNPIGIIPIGWLWAVIKTGGGPVSSLYGISTQISGLISGVLIYFTAIVSIFIVFKPWELLKNKFNLLTSPTSREIVWKLYLHLLILRFKKIFLIFIKEYKQQVNDSYKNYVVKNKIKKQMQLPHLFWNGRKNIKLEFKKNINQSIDLIKNKIIDIKAFVKEDKTRLSVNGLKTNLKEQLNLITTKFVLKSYDLDLKLADHKYKITQVKQNILNKYQSDIKQIKKEHKLKIQEIKVFKEAQIGVLFHEFQYRDNVIEIKANKLKTIALLNEQIKNIKSKFNLQKENLKLNKNSYDNKHLEQINKIKQEIKEVKKQTSVKLLEEKNKFKTQKGNVKKEKVQLQTILEQYKTYLKEEKQRFIQAKKQALVNKHKRLELIDMNRSKLEVNKAIVLLNDLKTLVMTNIDKNLNRQAIKSNDKTLIKALKIKSQIDEIFGSNIISEYDAPEYIRQKVKISLKTFKLIIFLEKQISYTNCRVEEQELINNYKTWIDKANQIIDKDKQQYLLAIKQQPRETLTDLEQLFNLEKTLKQQTNLKIMNLEKSVLKEVK